MAGDWYRDRIEAEDVPATCRTMLNGWQALYEKVELRRRHIHNDDSVDPLLGRNRAGRPDPGDPFAQVSRYQSDRLRQKLVEWVSRVAENHLTIEVVPPKGATKAMEAQALELAAAYNDWWRTMEERLPGVASLQDLVSAAQCAEPYAVLHLRRCEELWPEMAREYSVEKPAGRDAARYERRRREMAQEMPCGECAGEGETEMGQCPACEGEGMVAVMSEGYREKGDVYEERVQRAYADAGAPWHLQVIDFLQFVPEFDESPLGGLRRALVHFEVPLGQYRTEGKTLGLQELRTAGRAGGAQQHGNVTSMTPSDQYVDGGRVTVYQLWTRTHCYEWAEGGDVDAGDVRQWEHGYRNEEGFPAVPFWVIPYFNTGHPDPVWRFECALEGMYRLKEYVDRAETMVAATVEGQANPLTTTVVNAETAPLLPGSAIGPDGTPVGGSGTEASRIEGYTGEKRVLSLPMAQAVPQWLEYNTNLMDQAAPDTGRVDIESSTQAWTARQWMKQANIGPVRAIGFQVRPYEAAVAMIHRWQIDHRQAVIARERDDRGQRRGGKPLIIPPEELDDFRVYVRIGEESEIERITAVEHTIATVERGFGTDEDVYDAQGYDDPAQRSVEVATWKVTQPLKAQRIAQRVAAVMGTQFLLGPNGEFVGPGGQVAQPEDVAAANGVMPGPGNPILQQQQQGGGGGGPGVSPIAQSAGGQVSMPPMPALQPQQPGEAPLPGLRA